MNTKWFIFSVLTYLFLCATEEALAKDTIRTPVDSAAAVSLANRYDHRVHRYRKHWETLIPTQLVLQYAGNMGFVSVGTGWNYGKRNQWETQVFFGILPKYQSRRAKVTMTLKENYIPWSVCLKGDWNIVPLSCGLYFNTIFGSEFWGKEPDRYPKDYYPLLKTKIRANVFLGQGVSLYIPHHKRKFVKNVTAFYEVSTCDLYIRAMVQDKSIRLKDIVGLSLGLKMQLF